MIARSVGLHWAQLDLNTIAATKFWLKFVLSLWMDATYGAEKSISAFSAALRTLDAINGRNRAVDIAQASACCAVLRRELNKRLAYARKAGKARWGNDISLDCGSGNEWELRLILRWYTSWEANFVAVTYVREKGRKTREAEVHWRLPDSAMAKFFQLPWTAEQFAKDFPTECKLRPVCNPEAMVLESLGQEVDQKARHCGCLAAKALAEYVTARKQKLERQIRRRIKQAKVWAKAQGYALP